jgi:hypothetical protein
MAGPDEGRWKQSAAAAVTEWLPGMTLGRGGCTQGSDISRASEWRGGCRNSRGVRVEQIGLGLGRRARSPPWKLDLAVFVELFSSQLRFATEDRWKSFAATCCRNKTRED